MNLGFLPFAGKMASTTSSQEKGDQAERIRKGTLHRIAIPQPNTREEKP
jgi:hypothetical protein